MDGMERRTFIRDLVLVLVSSCLSWSLVFVLVLVLVFISVSVSVSLISVCIIPGSDTLGRSNNKNDPLT